MFDSAGQVDLFFAFRWVLMLFCASYLTSKTGLSVLRYMGRVGRQGKQTEGMRGFLACGLAPVRWAKFRRDCFQIGGLGLVAIFVIVMHGLVKTVGR